MIRKFTCAASLCALIAPVAYAATVSVPEKSQPARATARIRCRCRNSEKQPEERVRSRALSESLTTPALVQHQRVPSPRNVLPSAEVPQEIGAARLPHQGEVIEPQLLEAAPVSPAIFYFSRNQ